MTLVFILECLITFNINFFNAGFQSRYTSIPSKPTFSHAGNDVTFTWRYHLTHSDRANFKVVVFGIWMNGDISIPLVSVLRNGSAIFYSNRVSWLGNKTMASFRLHKVSIDDDRVYGCKLDFGAFNVLDSVRLTVIGKNFTINLPLFIPYIYIYIIPSFAEKWYTLNPLVIMTILFPKWKNKKAKKLDAHFVILFLRIIR